MPRLSVGVEGFDAMIQGGLPVGSSVVLQGPPGQEKLRFALTFIAEGLRVGASGLVVTSSQSPDAVLAELRNLGVNLDQVAHENRLRIVDWYSWSEESVQDVEERGAVVRSSIDLTNLGVALSRAITALPGDQPRRAVIELLSPATNVYELTQVYAFAQSAKRKFDRYQFTSLVLLEKEMHSASEVSTLHQPFDGVIEIERTRSGDRIVRKVGVLHLKDTSTDPTFRELEFTERGMRVVREAPKPATPLPSVPGITLESQEERARRLQLIMQIASERLKLNPRDADALFAMAAAQATLDDVRGGLQTLERLADLNADYPGLWVLKTKLHARLGETDRARQSRIRAQQSQAPEPQTTGATVPCPMCEAPVGVDATSCANCGVKFTPSRNLEDELDELGQAAIQEMVEEELRHETKPAPEPAKRPLKPVPKPPVATQPKPVVKPPPKKGLTNGLVLERRGERRTGMTNGLRGRTNGLRGRTNGLTNGLGRTNGLTHGVGRTNGLTNGVGRTNGLTNGLGHTNGLTNGLGRTNGLTNGLGRTNGITNGLGRTNGLTNGLAGLRTTGFHSAGLRGMMRNAGWKLYLIPLVTVALLLMPLFLVPEYQGPAYPIRIDGQFDDWAAVSTEAMSSGVVLNPNVDLVRFGMHDNEDRLAFYVQVRGTAFAGGGSPPTYDTLRIFLDTDRDPTSGYSVAGMGADRLLEVSGWGSAVNTTTLFEWDTNRAGIDWNGWIKSASIPTATSGAQVELDVAWSLLLAAKAPIEAFAHFQAFDGTFDETDYALSNLGASLVATIQLAPPQILMGTDVTLLGLEFRAHAARASYSGVTVTVTGTAALSALASLRLVDAAGNVLQERVPIARDVGFQFAPRILDPEQSESLFVRADVVGTTGETLGVTLDAPADVASSDAVVTVRAGPSVRTVGYLGLVPTDPRIDAGFAEWANASVDPADSARRGDVDLRGYGVLRTPTALHVVLSVDGHALQGVVVPAENAAAARAALFPGSVDSDRDTVPDPNDAFPFDFNNDGIDDTATGNDYDGDGSLDYPSGADVYLNTTIPATFPPAYANRPVSLYIGPSARPPLFGDDVARVFFDADNRTATGFRVNVLGADYLLEIRGRDGIPTYRSLLAFSGASQLDWRWTPVLSASVASDYAGIETSFPLFGLGFANLSEAYFEVMDWALRKDGSTDAILRAGGLPSPAFEPAPSSTPVHTLDLAGSEKWFFTNTNAGETVCTTNKDASTTAGSSATSTTLSTVGDSICWFSPDGLPDTVAGVWEVILDVDATDGTSTLSPNANGDTVAWVVSGTSGCTLEASEYQCVDETTNDGDTTYVTSTSSTTTDSLYNLADFTAPASLTVVNVQVEASCRKIAPSSVSVAIIVKSGGTIYEGSSGSTNCANSPTYTVWTDTRTTDPADGAAWTDADLDALQAGVRDKDAQTDEVRASHVKVTVTYEATYSVEINKCTNAACSGTTNLYPATNYYTTGSDVTIQTGSLAAETLVGSQHIQWKIVLVTGTSVTIRYNGANPGTDDSRATVPIPEVEHVLLLVMSVLLIVPAARRWRARRPCGEPRVAAG